MRLDYGAILFALATTAAAAPMTGHDNGQGGVQHEERFKLIGPKNPLYTPDGERTGTYLPPLNSHDGIGPLMDLTDRPHDRLPPASGDRQHGKRTYLVPEVQTYRLDHGRLIMDEAHRVYDPKDGKSVPINERSYLVPDQTQGTYRLENGKLIKDEAHRVPDPQPVDGDADAHAKDAMREIMGIMDKHGKRLLMPDLRGPGLPIYDGPNHHVGYKPKPKGQPQPKPKGKPKPKPVSGPFLTWNKHEERSYLVPEVQTYRLDHGRLIMDEAHRVHNNPDPVDNPYNMTVKPLPHHKRESDVQLMDRTFFDPLARWWRFGSLRDKLAQHNQEKKNVKREANEQLEERKLHSRFALLPDIPLEHEVNPAWQRIPAQESGNQRHPKFDFGQIQMLRRHEGRAQIHGTYGISDEAVESPRLRTAPLGQLKHHHDDDKTALEERTYLIPGVRTYRLDHGRLIMDEAHRVPDSTPSLPQNQKRSNDDYGIEARRLAPWLQEQIIARAREQLLRDQGARHTQHGIPDKFDTYWKKGKRDGGLSQDELETLSNELESQLAKRLMLTPTRRPRPRPLSGWPNHGPKHPKLPKSSHHTPFPFQAIKGKRDGGLSQGEEEELNSEIEALEARRFMLPPRPFLPPKWPSAGTHGVPGSVPGAEGTPHSDSHNGGKRPWGLSPAVMVKRDDTARVNSAIDEWAESAHTNPTAWADNAEKVLKAAFPGIRISRTDKPKDKRENGVPKATAPRPPKRVLSPEECRIRQQQDEEMRAKHRYVKLPRLPSECGFLYKRDEDTSDSTAEAGPKDGSERNSSPESAETSENDHEGSTGSTDSASGDDSAAVYASDSGSSSVTGSPLPTSTSSLASRPATTDDATKKAIDAVCALVKTLSSGSQSNGQIRGLASLCEKLQDGSASTTSTGSASSHITSSAESGSDSTSTSSGSDGSSTSGTSSASGSTSGSSSASDSSSTSTADDASHTDEQ